MRSCEASIDRVAAWAFQEIGRLPLELWKMIAQTMWTHVMKAQLAEELAEWRRRHVRVVEIIRVLR